MDIKKLEKLMAKENLNNTELFEFFKIQEKKQAVQLWEKNLSMLKFGWNDEIGYDSFELIYSNLEDFNKQPNVFYLEMMKISLFLRTFCDLSVDLISAFIRMIGVLEFGFISRKALDNMPEYVYFSNMFEEHKKESRNFLEFQKSMEVLDQLEKASAEINLDDVKAATDELSNLKEEFTKKNN
jgi:hypothetical protein